MFTANLFFMLGEDTALQCEIECTASSITAASTFTRRWRAQNHLAAVAIIFSIFASRFRATVRASLFPYEAR